MSTQKKYRMGVAQVVKEFVGEDQCLICA